MHEIKCPNCGKIFTVDETGYAAIVSQVRDAEFHKALAEREQQIKTAEEHALALFKANAEKDKTQSLSDLMRDVERLKAQIAADEKDRALAVQKAVAAQKDAIVEKEKEILRAGWQL